ncbi:MAG: hypothetical protein R8J85_07765 [Mariprofundales bacterium]
MNHNITLWKPNDSVVIPQSGMELSEYISGTKKLKAILQWNAAVDLDLHAFYRPKDEGEDGHIFFGDKGKKKHSPYIHLDKDMGVGDVGGNNHEKISIGALADVECILIATNIFRFFECFSGSDTFGKYDGKVKISTCLSNNEIHVPLTSNCRGHWCTIALIDNTDPYSPIISNINKVTNDEPKIDDYLDQDIVDMVAYGG